MKKFKSQFLFFAFCFCFTASAFAFDGERQGFTMGLGLGYALYGNPDLQGYDQDFTFDGGGLNFEIGHNFDGKNLVVWELLAAAGISEDEDDVVGGILFTGFSWYHYLQPEAKSFYTILGVGRIVSIPEVLDAQNRTHWVRTTGFGFQLGGGYEIFKQVQVSAFYIFGNSSDYFDKASNKMLYISVNVCAY